MGQVLGDERKHIVLASKFGMPMDDAGVKVGGSRRYIMQAVEDSLRRLRTDWLDLYQIHAPDPRTPIEETLRALDDLVRRARSAISGAPISRLAGGGSAMDRKANNLNAFVSCQDEYSLLVRNVVEPQLRAGDAAIRHGPAAVLSAGQRGADREVSPQRAAAVRHAAGQHRAAGRPLLDRTKLAGGGTAGRFRGTARATRCWNSRSVGCWLRRRSPASSPVLRGRSNWSRM